MDYGRRYLWPLTIYDGELGTFRRWATGELERAVRGFRVFNVAGASPASNIGRAQFQELLQQLSAELQPNVIEKMLVESIRHVAGAGNGIGKDCIAVVLPPPWSNTPVRVQYRHTKN